MPMMDERHVSQQPLPPAVCGMCLGQVLLLRGSVSASKPFPVHPNWCAGGLGGAGISGARGEGVVGEIWVSSAAGSPLESLRVPNFKWGQALACRQCLFMEH